MFETLGKLLSVQSFMPHGYCLGWDPALLFVMIAANVGIALAYLSIPAALSYFARRRPDLAYSWMFRLFAVFITACGLTHLMKVWTVYQPVYWLEAFVDALTAVVSLITAVLLWPLIPKALALRSPAALAEANAQLESMNQQLTAVNSELATVNDDLKAARDQALEASNLKSAFVASISHELRTPLTGILGMNELLLATALTEQQRKLANATRDSADTLLSIVNDILDLSKIEAGRMIVESVQFNPVAVVHDCVQVVAPLAIQKDLLLNTDIDSRIPSQLWGDPVRLHQILLNLLSNGVKFTQHGNVTVRAMVDAEDEQSVALKFSITDTGIGLSSDEQKYLFMPFTQVDSSTSRKYGGTGLGLAIAKRLVEIMGGALGVTSTKGQGSTFWFTVPLARTQADADTVSMTMTPERRPLPSDKRVLVVEDNPVLQQLALLQLENLGIKASAVVGGRAALEELSRSTYNLILMDCHLPDIDGFETTRMIRQQEAGSGDHVIVIAITAGAMRGDPEKCLNAGMDDYLSKPYTLDQLLEKLQRWLGKGSKVPE